MAREEYTYADERALAGSAIGASPELLQSYVDLQQAAYTDGPAASAAAQATADQGVNDAASAQSSANQAQTTADQGVQDAGTAQARADAAYDLAGTKVAKNVGPIFAAPTASPSRTALPAYSGGAASPAYDPNEVGALKTQVAALTGVVAALVIDLRGNQSLRNT